MDLYSNTIYMGSDNFGMPVPTFKSLTGSYRMSGCLETATEAFLRKRFGLVRNLLQQVGNTTIICDLPLPCYVKHLWCNDKNHMVNWAEADFNEVLLSGSSSCFGAEGGGGEARPHHRHLQPAQLFQLCRRPC